MIPLLFFYLHLLFYTLDATALHKVLFTLNMFNAPLTPHPIHKGF